MEAEVERYPLIRNGEGWTELPEPVPGTTYEAWRVICTDVECPNAWPPATHSHIEAANPAAYPQER